MTITPANGALLIRQGCSQLNKLYEEEFPDTKDGIHRAYAWASEIALGWHDCQDDDWNKRFKNHAA